MGIFDPQPVAPPYDPTGSQLRQMGYTIGPNGQWVKGPMPAGSRETRIGIAKSGKGKNERTVPFPTLRSGKPKQYTKAQRDTIEYYTNLPPLQNAAQRKRAEKKLKTKTSGAAGPKGPDSPKKDAKRKADADALAKWAAAIAENERIAAEERRNNNGGGGGSGGSGVSSVDRGMFETAGRQAIDRVNAVYAGEDARTRALMAQNAASNTAATQQLASGLANRYADMQRTNAATTADLAAQGFNVGNSGLGGQYQMEALQNAGNAQQAYMQQMQQMNALNESSRLADNSLARSAYESGIHASVNDSYQAALVAAQEAAASAAKSSASSAGKQVLNDQRQFNYDQDVLNSMFAGQPNFQAANKALDSWKGMTGPRIVAARHALRTGLRNPGTGMSPELIRQRWGGNRVNRMIKEVRAAQNTPYKVGYNDILNYQQTGRIQ